MSFVIPAPAMPAVPVAGGGLFPVRRIYCVGRNYAEHAQEMGFTGREPPFFFLKPADSVLPVADGATGEMAYPPLTANLHHEIELVVAIGTGGRNIAGTGTIDSAGNVGPIGGIRQKMYSARYAGAQYMFVPADNCADAVGHVPSGIRIFRVGTMTEALTALKVIAQPDGRAGRAAAMDALPTCTK